MAVMADFARMPTQRKVLVFVVIGAIAGLLYWNFVWKSLGRQLDDAQADHDRKEAQNRALEGDIPKFEALKAQYTQLKRVIDENQKALPTETELPAFFEMLNRKTVESGVEVTRWSQNKEEKIESFVKVPVSVELTGSFMQIKRFFASLMPKRKKPGQVEPSDNGEEKERIVTIENLSLTEPTVRNRELVLHARFIASTYRADQPVAPEQTGGVKKPAAAAAPSGQPLPPSNTPAGAKARTEGAMDKNDQRNKNGDNATDGEKPPVKNAPADGLNRIKGGM
jgi:Tfp pilus assembly protein PilO